MKPTDIHTFITTAAAIGANLIVAATAADKILAATAATDALIGTTDALGAEASSPTGIALGGIAEVKLGGTVANGDPITSDAASKGIKAVAAAATQKRIIGFALQEGVNGDIIKYRVAPGILTLTAAA